MKHTTPIIILGLLAACSPPDKPDSSDEARETRDSLRTMIEKRYTGINEFSAEDDPYLFIVQSQMRKTKHFLFDGFGLHDISQGDSLWTISFKASFDERHVLELSCDHKTAMTLISRYDLSGDPQERMITMYRGSTAVVAEIDNVQRIYFTVTPTLETLGDDVHTRLSLDLNSPLLFTGRLIEIH